MTFADLDLSKRTFHAGKRPVLVIQGDNWAHPASCDTILIVPLASEIDRKRFLEAQLETVETSGIFADTAISEPSLVKPHLIQPVHREQLLTVANLAGMVHPIPFFTMLRHLAKNLGIPGGE